MTADKPWFYARRIILVPMFIMLSIGGLITVVRVTHIDQKGYTLPIGWYDRDPHYLRLKPNGDVHHGFPLTYEGARISGSKGLSLSDPFNPYAVVLNVAAYGLLGWLGYTSYKAWWTHE